MATNGVMPLPRFPDSRYAGKAAYGKHALVVLVVMPMCIVGGLRQLCGKRWQCDWVCGCAGAGSLIHPPIASPEYKCVYGYDVDREVNWTAMPRWMPADAIAVIKGLIACDPTKRLPLETAIKRLSAL